MRSLEFGDRKFEPAVRMLRDMEEVIYDREWLKDAENFELYYMYRDLALTDEDGKRIESAGLRYDITVIPAGNLGKEYVKTAGHYHPNVPGTSVPYPEIYELLGGKAHYLLQAMDGGKVKDVILIEAGKGDKVIIPSGYGHVTINPADEPVMMANWVSRNFSSIYGGMKEKRGAAYLELNNGSFVRNENYGGIPEMRRLKPSNFADLGLEKGLNMYSLITDLEKLDFLNRPQDYGVLFERVLDNK